MALLLAACGNSAVPAGMGATDEAMAGRGSLTSRYAAPLRGRKTSRYDRAAAKSRLVAGSWNTGRTGMRRGGGSSVGSFFVDSVAGLDSNSGAQDYPFKTFARARQEAYPPGAELHLKCGSVFREELIDFPRGITIRSYGTGVKPWIKGNDIAANASFAAVGGGTPNVYSIAWSHSFGGTGENVAHRVWENGVMLRRVNDLATCNSTPGSFYAPAITVGLDVVYVHAADSSNVTSNGKVYELARRMWGVKLREFRAHASLHDLQAVGNAHAAGALALDGNMYRCIAWDGRIHNVYLRGYAEDCDAINMEPPDSFGASTMWVTHDTQGSATHEDGRDTIYRRCRALADVGTLGPEGGQNEFYTIGFYAHMSIGGTLGTVFWDECHAEHCVNGYGSSSSVEVAVMHKCTTGEGVNIAQNLLAPTVIVLGGTLQCEGVNSGATIYATDFGNPDVFKMRGVRVLKTAGGGVGPILQRAASSVNDVSRCSIHVTGGSVQSLYNGVWQFRENVVYGAGLTHRVGFPGEPTPSYTADRNVYWNPSGAFAWRRSDVGGNTDYSTIAAWRAAMGTEAASVNSDPQFTGNPALGVWTFAPGSPPMTLGAGADFEGEDNDEELQAMLHEYTDNLVTT